MAVSLGKGQKISLEKEAGSALSKIAMGLGWDAAKSGGGFFGGLLGGGGGDSIDLDASCLMFNDAGELVDTVWFRQLDSRDRSIHHTGDNLTGDGAGDDETIQVNLSSVPESIKSLVFTVNSFRGQTFERVANAYCRILDQNGNKEIAKYSLSDCKGNHTGMIMAKVYRHNGEWKMHAIGEPCNGRVAGDLVPAVRAFL